jgi:hypothetical protein
VKPLATALPDHRVWLRVASPTWTQPLDPGWAGTHGGRWNPPNSFPVLYLNANVLTAQLQIERLCEGMPFSPEDLSDEAYTLVLLRLPTSQRVADAVSVQGLAALGLPSSYPLGIDGKMIDRAVCQPKGREALELRLNGVWCRSAASADGRGRELAWFPGTRPARPLRKPPMRFGSWRYASTWRDIGLREQAGPATPSQWMR